MDSLIRHCYGNSHGIRRHLVKSSVNFHNFACHYLTTQYALLPDVELSENYSAVENSDPGTHANVVNWMILAKNDVVLHT